MEITRSSKQPFLIRLAIRLGEYSAVGVATFVFDLILIALLVYTFEVAHSTAIGLAFIVAVHINYFANRKWVYAGTQQRESRTYLYFLGITLIGALLIPFFVVQMISLFDISVLFARVLVGLVMGIVNFFINTFINFKFV